MKKLCLFLLFFTVLPLQAQTPVKWLKNIGKGLVGPAPSAKSVTPVLSSRANTTARAASQVRENLVKQGLQVPGITLPTDRTFLPEDELAQIQKTHPQPYLNKGKEAVVLKNNEDFITAEHNRKYILYANTILARNPHVPEILNRVKATAVSPTATETSAEWLAKQIPASTDVLCVGMGFYHNPSTIDGFSDFLTALRQQMPEREIILLSSYLEDGVVWTTKLDASITESRYYRKGYEPLWQNAYYHDISIIGMKRSDIFRQFTGNMQGNDGSGIPFNRPWEFSLEASAMEGKMFQEKLQAVREKHPDALIILHTGLEQGSLNFPFSVAKRLEGVEKNLYVASITSKTVLQNQYIAFPGEEHLQLTTRSTLFEQMYPQAHLPNEGAVSRTLAKDVGADAWIKIEFNPAKQDNGQY